MATIKNGAAVLRINTAGIIALGFTNPVFLNIFFYPTHVAALPKFGLIALLGVMAKQKEEVML